MEYNNATVFVVFNNGQYGSSRNSRRNESAGALPYYLFRMGERETDNEQSPAYRC